MMTPKEKAKELVNQFKNLYGHPTEQYLDTDEAKQCVLIAVDEIIKANPTIDTRIVRNNCSWIESKTNIDYWFKVKQEIEKL